VSPEAERDRALPPTERIVFTIGHSNHPLEVFVDLLKKHEIDVVVDVRSRPRSKYTPHFVGQSPKAMRCYRSF